VSGVVLWRTRREITKVPKKGHSEEKILRALHQAEEDGKVAEICRDHGISEATFYVWMKKYAGLALSELPEPHQLREENNKLKRLGGRPFAGPARAARDRAKKAARLRHQRELGRGYKRCSR